MSIVACQENIEIEKVLCFVATNKMVKPNSGPEIIYDPSSRPPRKSRPGPSSSITPSNRTDVQQRRLSTKFANQESENDKFDISKIFEDVQYLATSNMTWKERKQLENQQVVALGGKPPKKHRMPLSVAKVPMKRQKQREQKQLEEDRILGRFIKNANKHKVDKRKPQDRVLKASEGHFSKGVLNVKHLLDQPQSRSNDGSHRMTNKGKNKGKGKVKGKGKGKKGKKRGH